MFNPRERSQPITFFASLLLACLLLCGIASATPSMTLSKKSGPPTTGIAVSGRGFKANVGVDIYFDTKDKALIVTNGEGGFKDVRIHVPRSARPGKHWVTALERDSQKGAQKPFLVQTNWSQFHFDADGTRLNPYENVLNPRTVQSLGLKWRYSTTNNVWGSPAVADGAAYVATLPLFYALNADSGTLCWKIPPPLYDLFSADPAVANGIVYVGLGGTGVHAVDTRNGFELWSYPATGRVFTSPAVANGMVYFGTAEYDQRFYALKAKTGELVWSYAVSTFSSSPVVVNGVVYFGTDDDNVYALDAFTGVKLWNYTAGWVVRSSPAVANGVVYVGSYDKNVYALNAKTGAVLWSYSTTGYVESSPAVANGTVFVGSDDHNLYALDAYTGAKLWSYTTGNTVYSSPAVANGVVYVGSLDGSVYALNASTGARLWSYTTGDRVWSSPTVVNGIVYVGSDDYNVYAFGLPRGDGTVQNAASERPALKSLRPDFTLQASKPGAAHRGP